MLIQLKLKNGIMIPFPVTLFVFKDLLEATASLINVIALLSPERNNGKNFFFHEKIIAIINIIKELIDTMCNYGKLEIADIEVDELKIAIKLI